MRRLYLLTRDLHLYVGLFISPFILVFAISVFVLLHGATGGVGRDSSAASQTVTGVRLPAGAELLQGRARLDALRPVLDGLGVQGEIDFIRHIARERRLVIPVTVPGRDTTVTLDYAQGIAVITSRPQPFGEALAYLHRTPGPHNVELRGNAFFMRLWRLMADATAYLLVFVTVSGVYLWTALRAERRVGVTLLAAGTASFLLLIYAVAR